MKFRPLTAKLLETDKVAENQWPITARAAPEGRVQLGVDRPPGDVGRLVKCVVTSGRWASQVVLEHYVIGSDAPGFLRDQGADKPRYEVEFPTQFATSEGLPSMRPGRYRYQWIAWGPDNWGRRQQMIVAAGTFKWPSQERLTGAGTPGSH